MRKIVEKIITVGCMLPKSIAVKGSKKMKTMVIVGLMVAVGCSSWVPVPVCPTGSAECGNVCCETFHHTCESGQCVLTSCDTGFQMCPGKRVCIPFPSDCCANGTYCFEQKCASNNTCIPLWGIDCGNGRYCDVGQFCCNNGSSCCN